MLLVLAHDGDASYDFLPINSRISALTSVLSRSFRASPCWIIQASRPIHRRHSVHRRGIREFAAMISTLHRVFSLPHPKPSKNGENHGLGGGVHCGGTDAEKHNHPPDNTILPNRITVHPISSLIRGDHERIDKLVDPDDPSGPMALSQFNNGRSALQPWYPGVRPNRNTTE